MFGEGERQRIPRQFLSQIIEARVEEIFDMILQEIKRSGYDGLLPSACFMRHSRAGGIRTWPSPPAVRVGAPQDLQGLVDILGSPAYATSVGLVQWGLRHDTQRPARPSRNGHFRLPGFLKAFLPER
jgi:cell division protein FtsA